MVIEYWTYILLSLIPLALIRSVVMAGLRSIHFFFLLLGYATPLKTDHSQLLFWFDFLITILYRKVAPKVLPPAYLLFPHNVKNGCWWHGCRKRTFPLITDDICPYKKASYKILFTKQKRINELICTEKLLPLMFTNARCRFIETKQWIWTQSGMA